MYISITCTASVSAVAEIKRLYALHYSLVYILWSFLIIPRGCVCGGEGGWGEAYSEIYTRYTRVTDEPLCK